MDAKRWKIDDAEDQPLAVIEDTEDGLGVCEIGYPSETRADATPEQWERAHLIAAAPELLRALQAVTADHEERMSRYPHMEDRPNRVHVMDKARAAIAKAGGK